MKLKLNILTFFLLVFQVAFSQNDTLEKNDYENSTVVKIMYANPETCDEIEDWAKADIANNTMFLFLQGGIAPIIYSTDKDFEKQYRVYFYDFGCVAPDYSCVVKYNCLMFDSLTEKYGKKWIKKIRKDVIGFKDWKDNYRKLNNQL